MTVDCEVTLSKELAAQEAIKTIVDEANKTYLTKGVSPGFEEEAARITRWALKGKTLSLTIESGAHVRAPAAVLRLRKQLGAELGKKFRVGVRDVKARNITIRIPVPSPPTDEVLSKVKSHLTVKSVKPEGSSVEVVLNDMTEAELKRNVPDRAFTSIKETMETITSTARIVRGSTVTLPIVKQSPSKPIRFDKDPMRAAIELGWVKEFPGRGQWIYTAPYAQLFDLIRQTLLNEIVWKLNFQPFLTPKLIPLEVMKRMPGYLDDIPEGMYYVSPPPREPESFKTFKEKLKVTKEVPRNELVKVLKEPDYVLAPAQCEPFWQFYGGETLHAEDFPYRFYDSSGWTYRWEGGGVEGLVRLQEFQRIELTYLGTPDQIVETRDQIVDECVRVADKVLDLEWRVTAAIPFWAREGQVSMDVHDSENVSAYDIEIYLPYRGPRERAEWLEVTGCFVHKTKFVDSFKIRELKNRKVWTGCTGLGLSRWTSAFLATYGFDPSNWPRSIAEKFNRNYRIPKSVTWPPHLT